MAVLCENSSAPLLHLKQNNGRIKWVSLATMNFLFVIFWPKKLKTFWRPFLFSTAKFE